MRLRGKQDVIKYIITSKYGKEQMSSARLIQAIAGHDPYWACRLATVGHADS